MSTEILSTQDSSNTSPGTEKETSDLLIETSKASNREKSDLPIIETTSPSPNGNSTNHSKYILVGFDNYQRPQRNIIIFIIYFRRIFGIWPRFVIFPIRILYLGRLRRLDSEEENITCTRGSNENDNNMYFNCRAPVDENKNISKISIVNNFIFHGTESETILSSLANKTMDNIQDQTGDKFQKGLIVLENSVLEQNYKTNFKVTGDATEEIKDKTVTLFLDEKEDGNTKNVTCDRANKGNNKYELVCTSNSPVKAHLNGVSGETSGKSFLVSMKEGFDNDLVDINSSKNLYNKNSSSRGLTGGAITGIVLACVVAVAAVTFIIVLCNQNPKPPAQASALEFYHSSSSEL